MRIKAIVTRVIEFFNNNKKLATIILIIYGIICAFILVYPHFFDVGLKGQGWMDFRMSRVYDRYVSLIENDTVFTGKRDALSSYGLYLPYFMKWFNITDTTLLGCVWQGVFGFFVMMLYPPCFRSYSIMRSSLY